LSLKKLREVALNSQQPIRERARKRERERDMRCGGREKSRAY
jgi:hypothetical protein